MNTMFSESSSVATRAKRWRFNPLTSLQPSTLSRHLDAFDAGYLREAAIRALVPLLKLKAVAQAGESVELIERRAGKKRYVAALNYGNGEQVVTGLPNGTELLTGKPIQDGTITLKQYGVAIVSG